VVKFDPILARQSLFPAGEGPADLKPGPCAMGPTKGDTPSSMHVWVFQNQDDGLALASGDTRQEPVFTTDPEPRWRVRTALDPGSREFDPGKPAVAVAIALVERDGTPDIQQWSQAVRIAEETPFAGNRTDDD
jgi:hypothetical protein